ncbi:hypothetical protein QA641_20610 [Bradyrhizobium sp. CB1650]|nr:hypothetical protein [Bradyrhizobium sp. CB1650]WGD56084.1 hypothetical protein QA641_20610 [Bradyrhizobium sp. CB1650]
MTKGKPTRGSDQHANKTCTTEEKAASAAEEDHGLQTVALIREPSAH